MRLPEPVQVAVTRLPHAADLPLPAYETPDSAGMDVRAAIPESDPVTLKPGERALIPTGLRMALPGGYEAQVRPRSGLALKHGIMVPNSPGTIDADYRGELGIILLNGSDTPFTVERGMRIAQLIIAPVTQATWKTVENLDDSQRGTGGFGSTGLTE